MAGALKITHYIEHKKPDLFESDLPKDRLEHYLTKDLIAIDTETRGLNIPRDRLCLVQLCDNEGVVSFIRYKSEVSPNLKKLLTSTSVTKLFHYARFDIAVLKYYLHIEATPLWCTKIASKLVRTYTDRHSLKDLTKELLNIEMDKADQTSDWAKEDLSESQIEYAANDVRVLIPIYNKLKILLERENLLPLANRLYEFIPTLCELDLNNWQNIFEH
jgi:ribonuclease D